MRAVLSSGLLSCLLCFHSYAQDCSFQIVAGPNTLGDGGPAQSAFLLAPQGIASDASGNLYIADTQHDRIRKVSLDGSIATVAGNGKQGYSGDGSAALAASLNLPQSVLAASDGSFYISDTGNHRIRKVLPSGVISTIAGTGHPGFSGDGGNASKAELNGPTGLALDSTGALYIADTGNNRIRRIDSSGIVTTVAGSSYDLATAVNCCYAGDGGPATRAQLRGPRALAVAPDGSLYIADTLNYVIRRVAPDGTIATFAGTPGQLGFSQYPGPASLPMGSPSDLTLLSDGSLLIAGFPTVQISANGQTATQFSSFDSSAVASDNQGGAYLVGVNGAGGDQVFHIRAAGASTQNFAGANHTGQAPDGSSAFGPVLNTPIGITTAPDGSLYIADTLNGRILKLANGVVHSVTTARTPVGVAVDAAGNVFTAELNGGLVRKITPDGTATTVAGGGSVNPPLTASFPAISATTANLNGTYRLAGLIVHPGGNLFIALAGGSSNSPLYLLMVTPQGTLATVFTTYTPGTQPIYS